MWFFYATATAWFVLGAVLWARDRRVVLWEWAVSASGGFVMAGVFHAMAFHEMTADTETWSGLITDVRHIPEWVERYTYTTVAYVGKTPVTTVHVAYRTHSEHWTVEDNLGGGNDITQEKYRELTSRFAGPITQVEGSRPGFSSGNRNDDVVANKAGWIEPVTAHRTWTNRVRACPSAFSFRSVPSTAPVFDYPANDNYFISDRLVGAAAVISARDWDQMNSRLGPAKQVNVIAVGFGPDAGAELAQLQRAKWAGGKKNDVVICYGGGTAQKPAWTSAFGWTEKQECLRDLETIFLNGPVDHTIIPKVEAEIQATYQIKDWSKFDYLTIEPPGWSYWMFFLVVGAGQIGCWIAFLNNEQNKGGLLEGKRLRVFRRDRYVG